MSGLFYVGTDPSVGRDTENRINASTALNVGVSRTYVSGRVTDIANGVVQGDPNAARASKSDVDSRDAAYSSAAYYQAQDALLIPNASKGLANGVASLVSGKIPQAQIPVLGTGICRGPFPASHLFGGNTFDIPFKIADWQLGVTAITCQPWAFMAASIQSTDGRPVVEIRAGTAAQTTYASQTLISQGYGRNYFNDYQTVEVWPCDPDLGEGQDGVQDSYPPTMDMVLTAWMYDDQGGQVTTTTGLIVTATAYLLRVAL